MNKNIFFGMAIQAFMTSELTRLHWMEYNSGQQLIAAGLFFGVYTILIFIENMRSNKNDHC